MTNDEHYESDDDEDEAQSIASFKRWKDKTEQFPLSEFSRIAAEPTTILPAKGSHYIIANNLDELTAFLCKLDDLTCWNFALKEVYERDDDDDLEDNQVFIENYHEVFVEQEMRTLSYNEFYDYDERLHVTKCVVTVTKPPGIVYREDFLSNVTFPCLVQNSADGGFDRVGAFEINHCQVLELPGMSPRIGPVVHIANWL